jgi:hypothetical protein
MPTTLKAAVTKYLRFGNHSRGTRAEYHTTLTKWKKWGGGVGIEKLSRKEIREFLDWVHEKAVTDQGRTRGVQQTRHASTCERSFLGLGNRTSSKRCRAFPSPGHSAMWPDGII